jgi:hypothetical protein
VPIPAALSHAPPPSLVYHPCYYLVSPDPDGLACGVRL